ncbi:hypothetical protein Plhal304r1_c035g0109051 [Plasmopara halstedii]
MLLGLRSRAMYTFEAYTCSKLLQDISIQSLYLPRKADPGCTTNIKGYLPGFAAQKTK